MLACLLAALALAPPARAFVCKVSVKYSFVSLHWDTRLIAYGVARPGSVSFQAETMMAAIDSSFAAWSSQPCTDIQFVGQGMVDPAAADVNQVVFVRSDWAHEPQALALTVTQYGIEDGVIQSATINVNEAQHDFTDASGGCQDAPPTYDLQSAVTHEVGHLLGLDHTQLANYHQPPEPGDPTMAPNLAACTTDKRVLKADDIEGLCTLYPKDGPTGTCSGLPQQDGDYVSNTPLSCSAARGPCPMQGPLWGIPVLLASLAARRPRWGSRRRS